MGRGLKLAGAAALTAAVAVGLPGCKSPVKTPPAGGQGWSTQEQASWYNAGQGSRLMPMAWFKALEQPGAGGAKFSDPTYLDRFGILPPFGKADLPIGFAVNEIADDTFLHRTALHWTGADPATEKVPWVGLNCAACHTGRITYQGKTLTIDGGTSLFDFQSFLEQADQALVETQASAAPGADPARWDRFAKAVLAGTGDTAATRASLLRELGRLVDWERANATANQADSRYGHGRVDALGYTFNRLLLYAEPTKGASFNPSDAPVSYPHLWNISKQTQLQWNGVARIGKIGATDFGALGRNTGEVLAVFGEAVIVPPKSAGDLTGFPSSVDFPNLNKIEVLLTRLKPPAWPEAFGAPGPADALKAGAALFQAQCASCHTPHATYESMSTFDQMGAENRTDEYMACNAWAYTGPSGKLTGVPADYVKGEPLRANAQVGLMLSTTVKGALINKKGDLAQLAAQDLFGLTPLPRGGAQGSAVGVASAKQVQLNTCLQNGGNPVMAYKARPLEGIWATAPFLHNGSVPTLYDLLLPVDQRPKTFSLGTREYDPKKVGYLTAPDAPGNSFVFDTQKPANSNKGHVYGVGGLTDAQRLQLLDYLKTL